MKGPVVQRVSLTWVIEQTESISGLLEVNIEDRGIDVWLPLIKARSALEQMIAQSVYRQFFKVSFANASQLYDLILKHVPADSELDEQLSLKDYELWGLKDGFEKFNSVFRAELATLPIYLITPKGAFEIDALVNRGTDLFPDSLSSKVPEAIFDAYEAARCLAFERSTASGFHTFRVVESVLRRYWDHVSGGKARPEPQTLGRISTELERLKLGDDKVLSAIKQLATLHRNPIAHPEVAYSQAEATGSLGMSQSVVTHLLLALPDVETTTSNLNLSAQEV